MVLYYKPMSRPLNIVIVEKLGSLKSLAIKDFNVDNLYKKCGFKKPTNFDKQTEWCVKHDGKKYIVSVYAKAEGNATSENKYDFPPPIDTVLFYGTCAVIAQVKNDDGSKMYVNLSVALWTTLYEKLFGGFEDLATTAKADEEEEDELAHIPSDQKTKHGYLKDGFVVDSSDAEDTYATETEEDTSTEVATEELDSGDTDADFDDVGSELSEEPYEYDDVDK